MTGNPKLEDMGFDNLSSNCEVGEIGENRGQKISVSDLVSTKSDSFVVDMERLSHLMERDTNSSSRITLQRNLSRKLGSVRNGELKITGNDGETAATLHGGNTREKPGVVAVGATDHSHHQITITNGSTTTSGSGLATESKCVAKRFSFRRTPRTSDPRRILVFFATLSSMGTILLIYFTLSMGKFKAKEDYNSSI